jgi:YVTN family beta-propeller protein
VRRPTPARIDLRMKRQSWLLALPLLLTSCHVGTESFHSTERVGAASGQRFITPVNQVLTPAGRQIDLPGMRPQVVALSPDGKLLITTGKTNEIVVIDPVQATILQQVPLPPASKTEAPIDPVSANILKPDKDSQVSFTGLIFSPDGKRIYLSDVHGNIKVFEVDATGKVHPSFTIALPEANAVGRKQEIPAGLALSADGKRLYVALNLSNRLGELDAVTGQMLRTWDVGVAPYDVVLAGHKAYVSNWGGRRPDTNSVTGPAGRGVRVRVDSVRHIANEGSVSVLNLENGHGITEIQVGLHASALALSRDGRYVVVANAGSDTLSVIGTQDDKVVETIWAKVSPADLFGASPNALAFDSHGRRLFVCNGTQNAVAVINFDPGKSKLSGLIPVGWFPGAIVFDSKHSALYVANIKGTGSWKNGPGDKEKYNSHQYYGTLSLVPVPGRGALRRQTAQVLANYRYPLLEVAAARPRPNQPPRPVPERVGEPSVFKHVVYIIKENRTYDQILGDVEAGNGEPSLCVFGKEITPNQHKMVSEFVLLDNTYCSGVLSADGHQWTDTAFATDYMEKSFAGFPRSYPDGMEDDDIDALAYSPAGFIWDNAIANGRSLRVYGEFAIAVAAWKDSTKKPKLTFRDFYDDFTKKTGLISISSRPAIESLRTHLNTNTVGWQLNIPDIFRAEQFIKDLKAFETNGQFPNLMIICLPNDHTSGTKAGTPTPAAQVADNDLAFGQIVEAISRSPFWKETCIFAVEDDPQAGWDHVSGYRTTAYVISPYTKRGEVISTQYNQTSLIRTMELMLGLPPLNQMDATATVMTDCFNSTADFTPFVAVPNRVPLDQMNPQPADIPNPILRRYAQASAKLPLDEVDQCPEDLFNRILWHAMKGPDVPYPAWAITVVDDDD